MVFTAEGNLEAATEKVALSGIWTHDHWIPYRWWVQLAPSANFVQLLQFHLFVQCSRLISVFAFVSRHICCKRTGTQVITLLAEWVVRSEHSLCHGIVMTTYLAQHWVACISLNSAASPNFKEKKKSEATEEGKIKNFVVCFFVCLFFYLIVLDK